MKYNLQQIHLMFYHNPNDVRQQLIMYQYLSLDKKVDLRSSAYILALNRIVKAERLRGNL